MGIEQIYDLANPELFDNWTANIEDWGSLHYLNIYLPSGKRYSNYPLLSLQSAKIAFTKEMEKKGAKWIKRIKPKQGGQMTAKDIKEAAKHDVSEITGIEKYKYVFTPDEMQAFEDAICREQRYEIWEPVMNSSIVEQLDPEYRDYLEEFILNAPKPTTQ